MQCSDANGALNALIDGETVGEQHQAAATHVAECPHCTQVVNDHRHIAQRLKREAYVSAPAGLEEKIRGRLATEAQAARYHWTSKARRWMQQAAAFIIVAGLSALASWYLTKSAADDRRLEREVLAAHMRSLLQDAPVQIASSERHAVRPWFNGRVEFAPGVKDLTNQNFTLLGGRLDWIDGKRVATLVYKRRLHIINVFIWPSDGGNAAPVYTALKGYNAMSWIKDDMTYWIVSDLNATELAELQSLL